MKELLLRPGLYHIVNHISSFLDPKSLAQCRLVSKDWQSIIDEDRKWWIQQLEYINKQKKTILLRKGFGGFSGTGTLPKWNIALEQFISRKPKMSVLREFVAKMWMWFYMKFKHFPDGTPMFPGYLPPLHFFAAMCDIQFIQLLIDAGFDMEMVEDELRTKLRMYPMPSDTCIPFQSACEYGNIMVAQLLVKHSKTTLNADMKIQCLTKILHKNNIGNHQAIRQLTFDLFDFEEFPSKFGRGFAVGALFYLRSMQKDEPRKIPDGLRPRSHRILSHSRLREILVLTDAQVLNDLDYSGNTVLHLACEFCDIQTINFVSKALEERKSEIDWITRNHYGETPLECSITNRDPNVAIGLLQQYLKKQINVLKSARNEIMLIYACQFGNMELVKYISRLPEFGRILEDLKKNGDRRLVLETHKTLEDLGLNIYAPSDVKRMTYQEKMEVEKSALENLARVHGHKDENPLKTKEIEVELQEPANLIIRPRKRWYIRLWQKLKK